LRDDYEVSCKELDTVVEIAGDIGVKGGIYGCRMTGGGFGGCAVALVKTENVEAITRQIAEGYKAKTGIDATIFVSHPASGATVIQGDAVEKHFCRAGDAIRQPERTVLVAGAAGLFAVGIMSIKNCANWRNLRIQKLAAENS